MPGSLEIAWPGVRGLFTGREGGVSVAPFDSFNLGDHVGDDPHAVALNRRRLQQSVGKRPVFLSQVHGLAVQRVQADTPDGTVADACWTDATDVACVVMVADCLPVLLAARDGSSVAAVHAGWRGLVGQGGRGVLEALCDAWPAARSPEQRAGLRAWLGPCIGPAAFEVGTEVRSAFMDAHPGAAQRFAATPQPGKYLADLPGLARDRLAALGVTDIDGNNGGPQWCTVSHPSNYFSHRRDARVLGSTGRMAACIWRT